MNRRDLQRLANLRVKEAQVLIDNECYEGAYYLLGYAVECAFKACIAKQTRRFDFPDRDLATKSYTHNLAQLLTLSGLNGALDASPNAALKKNWIIVKDWSEQRRYSTEITKKEAVDYYEAVTATRDRVLPWIKKFW